MRVRVRVAGGGRGRCLGVRAVQRDERAREVGEVSAREHGVVECRKFTRHTVVSVATVRRVVVVDGLGRSRRRVRRARLLRHLGWRSINSFTSVTSVAGMVTSAVVRVHLFVVSFPSLVFARGPMTTAMVLRSPPIRALLRLRRPAGRRRRCGGAAAETAGVVVAAAAVVAVVTRRRAQSQDEAGELPGERRKIPGGKGPSPPYFSPLSSFFVLGS